MGVELDWRQKGVLAPARNMEGICWAVATVSACEAIHHIAHRPKKFKTLSVQQIVDCYPYYDTEEQYWGHAGRALQFIKANGGFLYPLSDYPENLRLMKQPCASEGKKTGAQIDDYLMIRHNEVELLEAVKLQPVIAMISSAPVLTAFQKGKGNNIIRFSLDDLKQSLDHFVLVIGYGNEDGVDYWLVQNSWGSSWNGDGCFRIERNVEHPNGTLNIARKCFVPIIYGHGASEMKINAS